jgi:chromate transporter
MTIIALYLLLLRATVTSFSGFASVPVIREDLVIHRSVLTDEELNAALAISQASPGPLGLYVVIVGYFVSGIAGAAAGILALATPAVLAIPILQASRRGRTEQIQGASAAIVIASSALMLLAGLRLAPTAIPTLPLSVIALAGFVALASGKVPPLHVVVLAGVVGLLVS